MVCLNGGLNPVDCILICHSDSLSSDTGDGRDRENFTSRPFLGEYRLINTILQSANSCTICSITCTNPFLEIYQDCYRYCVGAKCVGCLVWRHSNQKISAFTLRLPLRICVAEVSVDSSAARIDSDSLCYPLAPAKQVAYLAVMAAQQMARPRAPPGALLHFLPSRLYVRSQSRFVCIGRMLLVMFSSDKAETVLIDKLPNEAGIEVQTVSLSETSAGTA